MTDLRLYRLAFAPALAVVAVMAFSLEGVPAPVEPPPSTTEFEASNAASLAREIVRLGPTREPGSPADDAAADLVRERFDAVVTGEVAEQTVEADVDGESVEFRNVLLTLPGTSDRTIVVVAGRDARSGEGAPGGAAATGVLLELTDKLAVASREHTIVLASTSGASAEGQGARELIGALPERADVESAVVIWQPGFDEPEAPHVVDSGGGESPPIGLSRTADAILELRSGVEPQTPALFDQIARLAIPAASGEQAALIDAGVDAVAISSAGELPLDPGSTGTDRLSSDSLERFGPPVLALVSALDSSGPPASGPGDYLRTGDNMIPGRILSLLVLALLLPPLAMSAGTLARARRAGAEPAAAFAWAAEWWVPAAALLAGFLVLAVTGVIPSSDVPYDPARYGFGPGAAIALPLPAAAAGWLWWIFGLRRVPPGPGATARAGAAGVLAAGACLVLLAVNPYAALLLAPAAHVIVVLGLGGRRPAVAGAALAVSLLPVLAALVLVAGELDWGASALWQVAILSAGGGIGAVQVLAATLLLFSALALATAAAATTAGVSRPDRRDSGVVPPGSG